MLLLIWYIMTIWLALIVPDAKGNHTK